MNHGIVNKNAFQSTAQLMLADRKSNTYNLTSEWPWLWCNFNIIDDLDLTQIKLMSKWQISIFLEMTLTLTQWPWHDLDLRQVKLSWTDVQVAKLASPWDDLDLNPMTLKLKHDLDIVKMYHHTKNEVSMLTSSKVIAQTDRQTDTHTHTHDENKTSTTYVGGKYTILYKLWCFKATTAISYEIDTKANQGNRVLQIGILVIFVLLDTKSLSVSHSFFVTLVIVSW